MKHLRFTTFFFLIVLLIVLFSPSTSGQSIQPSPQTPTLSPGSPQQPGDVSSLDKSQPASQTPAADSRDPLSQRRFKMRYLQPVPPKNRLKLLPDTPLVPGVSGQRVAGLSGEACDNVLNRCFFLASSGQLAAQLGNGMQPAQPADEAWRKPVIGKAVTDCDLFPIDGCVQRHRRLPQPAQLRGPDFDPGIFLRKGKGNMCGSIISYNFSPGDNPQLESVTTCTPADAIVTRRAQGKDKKPPEPLFRTTELSTPQN